MQLLLALCGLLLTSCARAQSPEDEGRRVVDELVADYEPATLAQLRKYERAARQNCVEAGEPYYGWESVECQGVRLALAETELAAASRRYEASIHDMSQSYPLADGRQAYEERWRSIWAYTQRQWRELRDAECADYIFTFTGGSGANAGYDQCRADRTFERAAQVEGR